MLENYLVLTTIKRLSFAQSQELVNLSISENDIIVPFDNNLHDLNTFIYCRETIYTRLKDKINRLAPHLVDYNFKVPFHSLMKYLSNLDKTYQFKVGDKVFHTSYNKTPFEVLGISNDTALIRLKLKANDLLIDCSVKELSLIPDSEIAETKHLIDDNRHSIEFKDIIVVDCDLFNSLSLKDFNTDLLKLLLLIRLHQDFINSEIRLLNPPYSTIAEYLGLTCLFGSIFKVQDKVITGNLLYPYDHYRYDIKSHSIDKACLNLNDYKTKCKFFEVVRHYTKSQQDREARTSKIDFNQLIPLYQNLNPLITTTTETSLDDVARHIYLTNISNFIIKAEDIVNSILGVFYL